MNDMTVVYVVGIAMLCLGWAGHWIVFARPRYRDDAETIRELTEDLRDAEEAEDEAIDQLDQMTTRYEAERDARVKAETALGHRLLTEDGVSSLDAARLMRGRG